MNFRKVIKSQEPLQKFKYGIQSFCRCYDACCVDVYAEDENARGRERCLRG